MHFFWQPALLAATVGVQCLACWQMARRSQLGPTPCAPRMQRDMLAITRYWPSQRWPVGAFAGTQVFFSSWIGVCTTFFAAACDM